MTWSYTIIRMVTNNNWILYWHQLWDGSIIMFIAEYILTIIINLSTLFADQANAYKTMWYIK